MEKKEISELGRETNARVREVREHFGLSQVAFADKVRLGVGTIRNIEYNLTEPNPRYIEQIAEICGVDIVWLETGDGEMFRKMTRREKIASFVGEALADESDGFKSEFILTLSALSDDGWKKLRDVIHEFKKAEDKIRQDSE
nr:MAG TPA: Helix-turn-helix XRE-family like protein [Caudoviricetes sp.]